MHDNRGYLRYQHKRHALRHKRITEEVYHEDDYFNEFNKYDSFKIHCSCGVCSRYRKTNNRGHRRKIHGNYAPSKNWSPKDEKRIEEMEDQMLDNE